jgi:NDP-sugar pyrophosphorylase family protein
MSTNQKNLPASLIPPLGGGGAAMILAAGLGTRLKPWTDHHPKALALVNNKSLLQRNVEYLQQFGIYNVVVNVYHFADQIKEAIELNKGWGSSITISDEKDEILETGGGLQKAKEHLKTVDFFVLMNVDILTDLNLQEMITFHQTHKPLATLATTNRETSRYFLFNENDDLCGWRNVKTGQQKGEIKSSINVRQKAFSGIHIIDQKIFSLIKHHGKFSMVDVYLSLMDKHVIKSFDHSGNKFIDVGKPESIALAEKMFV